MTTKEMRNKRARLIEQARSIYKVAEEAKREPTADETRQFDAWMDEAETVKQDIERLERLETEERALSESRGRITDNDYRTTADNSTEALRAWFLSGSDKLPSERQMEAATKLGINLHNRNLVFNLRSDPLKSLADRREWEARAQSIGTASAGGNVVPKSFVNEVETALLTFGGMRSVASVIRTADGQDLPWPTENDTTNKGVIVAENTAVAEQDLTFGQQTLKHYKYSSKMIRVPVELLQDAAIDLASYIGQRLGERIGRITNEHFTTGTGTGQPQGVATGATLGKAGATGQTLTVTYDDLVDLQHAVNPAYRTNAVWMFNDATLKAIKKLKDSQNRPLWSAGLAEREPDTILGHAYVINQDVAAMAASAKSILFGDFSKYKIRDVLDVTLVRLDERFAEFHQVAFLAFSRHDGLLLDAGTNPVKFYQNSAT